MSKIYKKYQELKSSSNYKPNTFYLFKVGLFFIFIDNDAKVMSNYLNLKLGNLNETIVKCGFPINSLQKYLNLLKDTPYNIEIVSLENDGSLTSNDYIHNEDLKCIVDKILKTNINDLSISQAYEFLYTIQQKLYKIIN
ncbi:MAG: hypothetical protein ACI4UU_01815 [Clostridia bacterium]